MMLGLVRNYWRPYFGDSIKIQDLDFPTLNDFFFYLHTEKQLSGATVNKAINCGSRAMRYLFENKKIDSNPMAGIERFNPQQVKRGIPTESEVRQLLNLEWSNHFYKLAFKLGIFCGLRAGEVSGLRVCDLDLKEDIIHVNHSWNDVDGLKPPKNSDVRNLPIDHETLLELYAQARKNPQFSRTSYVFFSSVKTEQPVWPSCYIDGLCDALEKIGISETERKERNIVFHSLRHFCATTLSQRAYLKMVQAILGHKTEIMTKHYSDHETREKLKSMRNVMQVTWSDILNVSTF
jgi:integrase